MGCMSSSRQPLFANSSAGTWSLDEVKAVVEFMLLLPLRPKQISKF